MGEHLGGGEDTLKVFLVVADTGLLTVERELGGVGVESNVDTSVVQHLHALVVVLAVVNGVDTDGVDAELLEQLDVAGQRLGVGDRVGGIGGTTGLVGDTTDVEALLASIEGYMAAQKEVVRENFSSN